jgi:hypothetical protein
MIEIAPYQHMAIVPLLAVALGCIVAALIIVRLAASGLPRHRLYWSAIIIGVLCALGSGTLRSSRHSGTGTQTEWGWPRAIYTRWVSFEVDGRRDGLRWQGLAENTVFYGAAVLLLGSLVFAGRRGRPTRDGSSRLVV